MEKHPRHLRKMKILPPLPSEAISGCRKKKKAQATEIGTSKVTPSGTTSEVNQPESSLPISTEPKFISLETSELETETLDPEVNEHEFSELETLQPEEPQTYELVASEIHTHVTFIFENR